MNKFMHVILGIILWLSVFVFLLIMTSHTWYLIPIEQFFYIGIVILLSVINQSVLCTKIYIGIKYFKDRLNPVVCLFSVTNLCFIAVCLFYLIIVFLLQ